VEQVPKAKQISQKEEGSKPDLCLLAYMNKSDIANNQSRSCENLLLPACLESNIWPCGLSVSYLDKTEFICQVEEMYCGHELISSTVSPQPSCLRRHSYFNNFL